jgi:hypothetical protein
MDLLIKLEPEAAQAGGQIVPLLGNHEIMNILGDLRYVPPETYTSFADDDSEKRRKAAYQDYAAWYASHKKLLDGLKQSILPTTQEEWMAKHPAGFLEYREAFSAHGKYGMWLRHHATIVEIGNVLFVHGGIDPSLISMTLEQINSQVEKEIEEFDKVNQDLVSRKIILSFFTIPEIVVAVQAYLFAEREAKTPIDAETRKKLVWLLSYNDLLCMRDDGPLWFRGYDGWSDEEGVRKIDKVLGAYHGSHIVVGHTVQKTRHIRVRFDGKVLLIDTGMLSTYWPGGRASALEIIDGKFIARYPDKQEVLFEGKPPGSEEKGN